MSLAVVIMMPRRGRKKLISGLRAAASSQPRPACLCTLSFLRAMLVFLRLFSASSSLLHAGAGGRAAGRTVFPLNDHLIFEPGSSARSLASPAAMPFLGGEGEREAKKSREDVPYPCAMPSQAPAAGSLRPPTPIAGKVTFPQQTVSHTHTHALPALAPFAAFLRRRKNLRHLA